MVLRRRSRGLAIAAVVTAAVLVAGVLAFVITTGTPHQESRAYSAYRLLKSAVLQRCVDVMATGTLVGSRSDRLGAVSWSDLRIENPTVTATGSMLVNGRCDASRSWAMAADLEQTWTSFGEAPSIRRSTEGPSTGRLAQFNSGTPVLFRDAVLTRVPTGSTAVAVRGVISVQAHSSTTQDGLRFPVEVALG